MTTNVLRELLAEAAGRVVIMDGGMGSSVEDRGVPVRNPLWGSYALLTDEGRRINDRLHEEFVAAGAEILIANTHNASLAACRAFAPGDEGLLDRVNRLALESARRAVPEGARIAVTAGIGSAEGPYAEESSHPTAEILDLIAPQARALRDLGADGILFETLTTAEEIAAVADLGRTEDLPPFGAGLTCGADGRTLAGVPVAEAVEKLLAAEPAALFVQCTRYDLVEPALRTMVETLDGRAVPGVYANDGRVWTDMRWHGERITPGEYAAHARRWIDAGARIVGGCCGTDPTHVRAITSAAT
jgi:homocysteine S-methyltransferase